jgi:hypothetical protein
MAKRVIPDYEEMKSLYESGLSGREVAESLGLNVQTVSSALKRIGVALRTTQQTKALQKTRGVESTPIAFWTGKKQPAEMVERRVSKIRGENHYLWKGGHSRREYRKVKAREVCARCHATENLGLHHINLDHYDNDPDNLEVLCVSCHSSVHKQAYWDAIHRGEKPSKSNGPIGWKRGA